jgi:hypothetical protein
MNTEDRKLSELFQILLDNIYNLDGDGLCVKVQSMYSYRIIGNIERIVMLDYIRKNPPKISNFVKNYNKISDKLISWFFAWDYKIYDYVNNVTNGGLYWIVGDYNSRIKWLKTHIKILKEKNE